jgi:hypothetical protein
MVTTNPIPLGVYPHDRLCGQIGIIPISARIIIARKTTLGDIIRSHEKRNLHSAK